MAVSRGDSKGDAKGDSKDDSKEKLSDFVFNCLTLDNSEKILKKALEERKSELVWLVRESSQTGSLAVDYVIRDKKAKSITECLSIRYVLTKRGWEDADVKDSHPDIKITPENIDEHIGQFFSFLEKVPFEEGEPLPFSAETRLSPSSRDHYFIKYFYIDKIERSIPSQICALSGSLIAAIFPNESKSEKELKHVIKVYDTAQREYKTGMKGVFNAMVLSHDGSHLFVVDPWGLRQFEIKTFFFVSPTQEDFNKINYLVTWKSLTPHDIVCDKEGRVFISFTNGLVMSFANGLTEVAKMESAPRLYINENNQLVGVCMETKKLSQDIPIRGFRSFVRGQHVHKYSVCQVGKESTILDWKRAPSLTASKFFLPNKFAAIEGFNEKVIKIVDLDSKAETQLPINDKSSMQLTTNSAGHLVAMSSKGHIKVWDMSQKSDSCINEFKINVPVGSNFVFYVNPFTNTLFYENHLGRFQELFLEDFNLQKEEVEKCFGPKDDMKENDICKNMPFIHKSVVGIMLDFLRHEPSEEARVKKELDESPRQKLM